MMSAKISNYFIGRYLSETTDVFEEARIIMFYRFLMAFAFLFIMPVAADYAMGLKIALVKHFIDLCLILVLLFSLRFARDLNKLINFFFSVTFVSYSMAFIILNPDEIDPVGILWAAFFLALSALLQRGAARMLYCLCLGWVPIFYVLLNIQMKGALTIEALHEKIPADPPVFLLFLPVVLLIVAVWSHANTIQKARETITEQKRIIEEKQAEIVDSIHYARRIQGSVITSEKYIEKILKRLKT
jgi:hypothetical protein